MKNVVHVVDDDESFRKAVSRQLRAAGHEVATYESAQQLLAHLPNEGAPGCILLDVQLPGLSGPDLQGRMAELGFPLPIVFLTGKGDIPTSVRAIKAGAEDFLTKPVAEDVLLRAIDRAIARCIRDSEQQQRMESLRALIARLTPRERQVYELIVRGNMNKQIARELGTTERTVKAHRQKVMEKTGAKTLAELVSISERLAGMTAAAHEAADKPNRR